MARLLPKGLALIAVQLLCLAKRQDNGLAAMDLRRVTGITTRSGTRIVGTPVCPGRKERSPL